MRLLLFGLSFGLALGLCAPCWAAPKAAQKPPKAGSVRQLAEGAVKTRQRAQKKVDNFAPTEAQLMDKIEQAEKELEVVLRQRKKAEAYLAGQRAKVAELQRRLAEIEKIRSELEPYLDETQVKLAEFVKADLPFLGAERTGRLDSLQQALNDYDAGLAEKTRRLLEALGIEARYGATVDATVEELEIAGRSGRVTLLRLGRLGLFALSPDGREAWRFDPAERQWKPVSQYARDLEQAAEIASRRRVVSLVTIPTGRAGEEKK